jgi:hypothetical protein
MMDEIYSNATLTIAAGSSLRKSMELFVSLDLFPHRMYVNTDTSFTLDADWGLPGVSGRRGYAQCSQSVESIELTVELPSFQELNSCTSLVWNTKGWTLQEKVDSHDLLISSFQNIHRE